MWSTISNGNPCGNSISKFVSTEIYNLLCKVVISLSPHEEGEFVSPIFLTPKKDESFRMILNLKKFYQFVRNKHFKVESLHHVITMMKPSCFMASLDIRDAYYSVLIYKSHQRYLKFVWWSQIFQFTCLPYCLDCTTRVFTKLLKALYSCTVYWENSNCFQLGT